MRKQHFNHQEKKTVLILSASSGAGYVRAGNALVSAFEAQGVRAFNEDTLKYTNALFRSVYSRLYLEIINRRPEFFGSQRLAQDSPWNKQRRTLVLDRMNSGRLIRLIEREEPELVICTHFLPAEILLHLRSQRKISVPIGVAITGFGAHAMWLHSDVDWYFVGSQELKWFLIDTGIAAERIHITGIPIDPVYAEQNHSPALAPALESALESALNINTKRPLVLVRTEELEDDQVEAVLRELDRTETDLQTAVLCGRREKLQSRLSALKLKKPCRVLGQDAPTAAWMRTARIVVALPEGVTAAEALATATPIVVIHPEPGHEERNSDFLLEQGVAMRCGSLGVLHYKIDGLLHDPARMADMQSRARALAHQASAMHIAAIALKSRDS